MDQFSGSRSRSPYIDNDSVALMYQAPPQLRRTNATMLRLISDISPLLAGIETDIGYGGNGHLAPSLRRLSRYLLFKAGWYYNAGMPHWLARLDHNVLTRSLEIFLWARTRLNTAGYGSEISCSI